MARNKNRENRGGNGKENLASAPTDRVDDILYGTAADIIRRKVMAVARRYRFQSVDIEDLIQSLTVHMWERSVQFDPHRGTWWTYCTVVVDRKLKSMLRQKRQLMIRRFVQLPDESEIEQDRLHPRRTDDPRETTELALDLEERILRLPSSLQEMCRRVQHTSLTEAARDMGIPRQTFVDRLRRLAHHFRIFNPRKS